MPQEYAKLIERSILNKEGIRLGEQMFAVKTGEYTARCAHAKYIVDECNIDIAWNDATKPIKKSKFEQYWQLAKKIQTSSQQLQVGQAPHHICFSLQTELHWHQAFAQNLFFTTTAASTWELICVPSLQPSTEHPEIIAICFSEQKILIAGTAYAGEIKKAMFTVMNYLLPQKDILPLHCAAMLNQSGETSLMLGLSGTGKTSLSSIGSKLIGDDEHAWCDEGIFNLEAGCYAKCANLSQQLEPEIYAAIQKRSILENVIPNQLNQPDFHNLSITENIRAAYHLSNLKNKHSGIAPHPKHIIFLCCDLYGVMPALSKLTHAQARQFFLCGYTARVGSTEVGGHTPIEPISSPCFGKPFFPLKHSTYADLLLKKIQQHNCQVWLLNTGWINGDVHTQPRIPIQSSKLLVDAIINHKIHADDCEPYPQMQLNHVQKISGQQHVALYSSPTWKKSKQYQENLTTVQQFIQQIHHGDYCEH